MAQPVFYQTLNNVGIDPTTFYNVSASVTPETPSPPFALGTRAFGNDGSEFIFVYASTTINPGDFVLINAGTPSTPYLASSLTTTNVASSLAIGVGSAGLVSRQSITYVPTGAYFWALMRGSYVPAQASGATLTTNTSGIQLYTTATAGAISSTTGGVPLYGIVTINSITVSIPTSVVPPIGLLTSTGYTQGPVVNINNAIRTAVLFSSTTGTIGTNVFTF